MDICIVCGKKVKQLGFYLDHPMGKICGDCVQNTGAGFGDQFPVERVMGRVRSDAAPISASTDAAVRALAGTGTEG